MLPPEIKDNPTLSKYKSVPELANAYINAQRFIGGEKLPVPKTDEDFALVYDKLGRPQSPEEYKIELPKEIPSEFVKPETMASFKSLAHKIGLNDKQAGELAKWYFDGALGDAEAIKQAETQAREQGEAALKREWGNGYERKIADAQSAFKEFGGDELGELMVASGLGNHPAVLKAWANIAAKIMPDRQLAGDKKTQGALTPEEAKAERLAVMAHPAYTDKYHPEHALYVQKAQKLFQQEFPD